ncbi:frizzled-6 [Alligator mississippiensis]|uniref:Frizzled-6 n=1 Tax=Alligator mississippiensis TaxID=8496 RepID=A0A151MXS3_ALLMI|nr:frizzled-6 [Alligator mississippiensis]
MWALVRGHSLFTCEPVTAPRCTAMTYNMTFFPNLLGHYDQDTAAVRMEPFLPLVNLHCSPNVHTFLCRAFVPACVEPVHVIHPCRSLCERVYADCKQLMDTFGIIWPEELECNRLVDCDETAPVTAPVTTKVHGTQKTLGQTRRDYGFWCPRHLQTSSGQAGIISLNHVRQVIQHDGRNQEKLKKFMIRIGVFSGLYLVPLVALLGCYVYELVYRRIWETTWVFDHCDQYHIPCPYQAKVLARPEIFLFLMKYLLTLIVGISPVFWVGSKKTCSEWANFFNRNRKRDPISESRRVLQESCEFFLKHNSKVKHKKKHYKSSSHKLKVISKSMGTSTGAATNHGTSAVAIANHDYLSQETFTEIKTSPEMSEKEMEADRTSTQKVEEGENVNTENALRISSSSKLAVEQMEKRSKVENTCAKISLSESVKRMGEEGVTPKSDLTETHPLQDSSSQLPEVSQPGSAQDALSLPANSVSDTRKDKDFADSSNP